MVDFNHLFEKHSPLGVMFSHFMTISILRNIAIQMGEYIKVKRNFDVHYAQRGNAAKGNMDRLCLTLDLRLLKRCDVQLEAWKKNQSAYYENDMRSILMFLKTQGVGITGDTQIRTKLANPDMPFYEKKEKLDPLLKALSIESPHYGISDIVLRKYFLDIVIESPVATQTLDNFMQNLLAYLNTFMCEDLQFKIEGAQKLAVRNRHPMARL